MTQSPIDPSFSLRMGPGPWRARVFGVVVVQMTPISGGLLMRLDPGERRMVWQSWILDALRRLTLRIDQLDFTGADMGVMGDYQKAKRFLQLAWRMSREMELRGKGDE